MSVSKLSLSILEKPIHIEQIWGVCVMMKHPMCNVMAAKSYNLVWGGHMHFDQFLSKNEHSTEQRASLNEIEL